MTEKPFRLLHCADLHLDAVLGDTVKDSVAGELTAEEKILLRDAPLLALENIGKIAIENEVDVVVIAGDIFDGKENAAKEQRVRSRLTSMFNLLNENDIKVYVAVGNHDPLRSIQKLSNSWPGNVHLFSPTKPETRTLEIRGQQIAIHGVSYATTEEARDLSSQFPARIEDAINIGVLHTNVGGDDQHKNYAPSTIDSLTAHSYDYFALGHVHKREILTQNPMVAYSGNSQGLHAKGSSQVPKGCVIISISSPGAQAVSEFIATDVVRYISCDIRAEEFLETDDIVTYAIDEISKACENPTSFYLVRASIDTFETIEVEAVCEAINDSRSNFFLTSLHLKNSYRAFSELVNENPFYKSIQEELKDATQPSLEDLYSNRASAISKYIKDIETESVKDEAAEVILSVATDFQTQGSAL